MGTFLEKAFARRVYHGRVVSQRLGARPAYLETEIVKRVSKCERIRLLPGKRLDRLQAHTYSVALNRSQGPPDWENLQIASGLAFLRLASLAQCA